MSAGQAELAREQQALLDAGGDPGGWQSDSEEEEFFRREAEFAERDHCGGEEYRGSDVQHTNGEMEAGIITSFIDNLSVE